MQLGFHCALGFCFCFVCLFFREKLSGAIFLNLSWQMRLKSKAHPCPANSEEINTGAQIGRHFLGILGTTLNATRELMAVTVSQNSRRRTLRIQTLCFRTQTQQLLLLLLVKNKHCVFWLINAFSDGILSKLT